MTGQPVRDRRIPDVVGVTEAAEILGITRQGVLRLLREGRIPAARAGEAWVIRRAEVERRRDAESA